MILRLATRSDEGAILALLNEAAGWIRTTHDVDAVVDDRIVGTFRLEWTDDYVRLDCMRDNARLRRYYVASRRSSREVCVLACEDTRSSFTAAPPGHLGAARGRSGVRVRDVLLLVPAVQDALGPKRFVLPRGEG